MTVPLSAVPLLGDDSVLEALDFAYNAFFIFYFLAMSLAMPFFILKTKCECIKTGNASDVL